MIYIISIPILIISCFFNLYNAIKGFKTNNYREPLRDFFLCLLLTIITTLIFLCEINEINKEIEREQIIDKIIIDSKQ